MKSWKTSLGGALGALGLAIVAIDPQYTKLGLLISAFSQFFNGLFGRDNNVTSEQANAGKEKPDTAVPLLLLGAVLVFLFSGCASSPNGGGLGDSFGTNDIKLLAAIGTSEAIIEDERNRAVLQELSDALDVFCGSGEVDSLVLYALLRQKLGDKADGRLGYLFLLVDRFGSKINPSDYVAWGGIGCGLREGIKTGLTLIKK